MKKDICLWILIIFTAISLESNNFKYKDFTIKKIYEIFADYAVKANNLLTQEKSSCPNALLGLFMSSDNPALFPFIMNSAKGLNDLGDYDSCVKIPETNRYITLHIKGLPVALAFGFCMPKECEPHDFEDLRDPLAEIMNDLFKNIKGQTAVDVSITGQDVRFVDPVQEKENQGGAKIGFYVFIGIVGFFGLACILSTLKSLYFDETEKDKNNENVENSDIKSMKKTKLNEIIECFDLRKNWDELVTNKRQGEQDLGFFDGIRVIAISWVIYGHSFYTALDQPMINPDAVSKLTVEFDKAFIYNGNLSVDVFFFLSAFLVSYVLLKKSRGWYKFDWMIYVHRVIRLYPLILFCLGFFCYVLPLLDNGPIYYRIFEMVNTYCAAIWYRILLFFVNFRPWGYNCIDNIWYISVDYQMFLITPFIIWVYTKKKLFGVLLPLIIILINVGCTIVLATKYDIYSFIAKYNHDYEEKYYEKPYTRAGTYMIGILAGFAYYEYKAKGSEFIKNFMTKIYDNIILRIVCYLVGANGIFWIIQSMYWMNKNPEDVPRYLDLLTLVFNRDLFIISLVIFILPVLAGRGRLIQYIFGNDFFYILGKLSYGAYMLHQSLMDYYVYSKKKPIHFGFSHITMQFWAYWIGSFILATITFLFIEQPIFGLERILLMPVRKPKPIESKKENNDEETSKLSNSQS